MRDDIHDRLLAALEAKLPAEALDTWIRPLRVLDARETRVELGVPTKFFRQQIEHRYLEVLQGAVEAVAGPRAQLVLTIDRSGPIPPPPSPPPATAPDLDPRYSFETFVVGSSNQFAQAACLAVAESPVKAYNPLFIYGGVGLGKTHLLHAIGNLVRERFSSAKVRYLHAEQYVSDLVRAVQHRTFDQFKRYYQSLDLLLIDDIQFFQNKDRTQEEFFYTFNALLESRRQIVITADSFPKEISGLEDRLKTRFGWGLTVAVEPPMLGPPHSIPNAVVTVRSRGSSRAIFTARRPETCSPNTAQTTRARSSST